MIRRWLREKSTPRQRITDLEAQVAQLTEENTKLRADSSQHHQLLAEANRALDEARIERDKYKLQLDEALKKPARPPRSNSRAKQTEQE